MKTPPEGFVRDLHAFDPDLRVRWAPLLSQWFIETRCLPQAPAYLQERPSPLGRAARAQELWRSWAEGYLHVLSVDHDLLSWPLVAPVLAKARIDTAREKEALLRRLEEAETRWEASIDRQTDTLAEAFGDDMYEMACWATGRRISTYVPRVQETPHEGFVVRERRGGMLRGE